MGIDTEVQATENTEASDISKLQETLKKERQARKELERKLKDLEKSFEDIDVNEYQTLKSEREEKQKQLETKENEVKAWKQKYEQKSKEADIRQAFLASGGREVQGMFGSDKIVLQLVDGMTALDEKGNVIVVGSDGKQAKNDKGEALTLQDVFTQMANSPDTATYFHAKDTKSGFGVSTSKFSGTGKTKAQLKAEIQADATLSPARKMELAREYGI